MVAVCEKKTLLDTIKKLQFLIKLGDKNLLVPFMRGVETSSMTCPVVALNGPSVK